MPWARLDDGFYSDPDVMAMGLQARALYVAGLVHCARGLTDGFIRAELIAKLAVMADVEDVIGSVQRLGDLKVWTPVDGGYKVRNWERYNQTSDHAREDRAAAEARKAEGRARGFASVTRGEAGRFTASTASSGENGTASSGAKTPLRARPLPVPYPVPSVNPVPDLSVVAAATVARAPAGATGIFDETSDGEKSLDGAETATSGVAAIDPVHDPPIDWFPIKVGPKGPLAMMLVECRPAETKDE